jgi:hypothetical protein
VKCEGLVCSGAVQDYAELAHRQWVTRARFTKIMNLLRLAAPIQEDPGHDQSDHMYHSSWNLQVDFECERG